jgi:hypothetical protein
VHLSGLKFCKKQQALFVAGTVSGKGYVFHVRRVPVTAAADKDKGSSQVSSSSSSKYVVIRKEVLDFSLPSQGYINDVALTPERAYFTNSFKPVLHWVLREYNTADGAAKRPMHKVGLGHFFDVKLGQFHANGIATFASKPRKDVLLLANTHRGNLYSVTVSKAPAANATSVGIAALPAAGSTATAALNQAAPRAVAAATAAAGAARVVAAEAMPALAQASRNVAQLLGLHKHANSSSSKQAVKTAVHKAVPAEAQGVTNSAALAALLRGKLLELSSNSSSGAELIDQLSGGADNNQLADDAAVLPSSQQNAGNGSSSGSGHVAPQPAMARVAAHAAAKPHNAPGSKREQQQRLVQQAHASAHSLLRVTKELQATKATISDASSSTVSDKPVDSKAAVASGAVTAKAASSKAGSHVSSAPDNSSSQASSSVAPAVAPVAQATLAKASNKPDAQKMMQSLLQEVHAQMAASSAEARKASTSASAPSHHSVATASKHAGPLASKAKAASDSGHNAHTFLKQLAGGVVAKLPSSLREATSKARLTAQRIAAKATEVAHGAPAARALLGVQTASGMFHEQLGSNKRANPMQWSLALADSVADKLGIARHGSSSSSSVPEAEVEEIRLPNVPGTYTKRLLVDGLWVPKNASTVFVVDNYNSRVWGLDVRQGLGNATLSCVWQGPELQVPTTLTMQDGRLWVVNAHLDTCFPFLPCLGHSFELLELEPGSCQPFAPSSEV